MLNKIEALSYFIGFALGDGYARIQRYLRKREHRIKKKAVVEIAQKDDEIRENLISIIRTLGYTPYLTYTKSHGRTCPKVNVASKMLYEITKKYKENPTLLITSNNLNRLAILGGFTDAEGTIAKYLRYYKDRRKYYDKYLYQLVNKNIDLLNVMSMIISDNISLTPRIIRLTKRCNNKTYYWYRLYVKSREGVLRIAYLLKEYSIKARRLLTYIQT